MDAFDKFQLFVGVLQVVDVAVRLLIVVAARAELHRGQRDLGDNRVVLHQVISNTPCAERIVHEAKLLMVIKSILIHRSFRTSTTFWQYRASLPTPVSTSSMH